MKSSPHFIDLLTIIYSLYYIKQNCWEFQFFLHMQYACKSDVIFFALLGIVIRKWNGLFFKFPEVKFVENVKKNKEYKKDVSDRTSHWHGLFIRIFQQISFVKFRNKGPHFRDALGKYIFRLLKDRLYWFLTHNQYAWSGKEIF